MNKKQIYLKEADELKQIYLKEDNEFADAHQFHESLEFIFVTKGTLKAIIDDQPKIVSENSIVFVDEYRSHRYEKMDKDTLAIVLVLHSFYREIFRELEPEITFQPFMTDGEKNKEIFAFVRKWLNESNRGIFTDFAYANMLFSLLSNAYPPLEAKKIFFSDLLKKMLNFIHQRYSEKITLQIFAKSVGYTPDYCSRIFKQNMNCSFGQYLNVYRIKKVEEILAAEDNDLNTYTVILNCGFGSAATYYRAKNAFEKAEQRVKSKNK